MNEQNTSKTDNNEEISLKELILKIKEWMQYLWNKKLIIVVITIIGSVLGFMYSRVKKSSYKAVTSFVLEDGGNGGGLGQYAGLASMVGINVGGEGGGIFQGDNIIELYKSRIMIEKTLLSPIKAEKNNQLLIDKYIEFNKLREKWKDNKELSKVTFKSSRDSSFSRLQDSIILGIVNDINKNYLIVEKPDKVLSVIQVTINAPDETFAKYFNEQLVNNVNEFYVTTKTKKSLDQIEVLQRKTDSVRAVMNGAIYKAVAVNDATPNINPTKQVLTIAPSQKAQFSAETNKAILGELVKNLELAKMSAAKETPLIQTIDTPLFPLEKDSLGAAKGTIFGMFIFGFLTCLFLIVRKLYQDIMNEA